MLVISHNLTDVFSVADRVAVLYLGRLVSAGPASDYDTPERGRADDHRSGQRTRERPHDAGARSLTAADGGLSRDVREPEPTPREIADGAPQPTAGRDRSDRDRPTLLARLSFGEYVTVVGQARPQRRERRAARHRRPGRDRHLLPDQELASSCPRGNLVNLMPQSAVHHHARHGRGLRAAARRDRPVARLHRRPRRGRRPVDARHPPTLAGLAILAALAATAALRRSAGHHHHPAAAARRSSSRWPACCSVGPADLPDQQPEHRQRRRRSGSNNTRPQRHRERHAQRGRRWIVHDRAGRCCPAGRSYLRDRRRRASGLVAPPLSPDPAEGRRRSRWRASCSC